MKTAYLQILRNILFYSIIRKLGMSIKTETTCILWKLGKIRILVAYKCDKTLLYKKLEKSKAQPSIFCCSKCNQSKMSVIFKTFWKVQKSPSLTFVMPLYHTHVFLDFTKQRMTHDKCGSNLPSFWFLPLQLYSNNEKLGKIFKWTRLWGKKDLE